MIASTIYADTRVTHVSSYNALPTVGDPAILYFAVDTRKFYLFAGTAYKEANAGAHAWKSSTALNNTIGGTVNATLSAMDVVSTVPAVGDLVYDADGRQGYVSTAPNVVTTLDINLIFNESTV